MYNTSRQMLYHILYPVIWARSQRQGLLCCGFYQMQYKHKHIHKRTFLVIFLFLLFFTSPTHIVKHSFGLFLGTQAWICSNSIQCSKGFSLQTLIAHGALVWQNTSGLLCPRESERENPHIESVDHSASKRASALRVMKYSLSVLKHSERFLHF